MPGFRPKVRPYALTDREAVFAAIPGEDIFDECEIDRASALVIQRPDMYVAGVYPLTARTETTEFFKQNMVQQ